jgi:DNA replication protein DnaC
MAPASEVLPYRFVDATMSKVENITCRKVGERYLEDFWTAAPQGIAPVFIGRTQAWKSYTAAVIVRAVVEIALVPAAFVDCMAQLTTLDRFREEDQRRIRKWTQVAFLVFDEFTSQKPDSYGADVMRAVAAARFGEMRPTLWTGNLSCEPCEVFAKIGGMYGSTLARRIQDGGKGYSAVVL